LWRSQQDKVRFFSWLKVKGIKEIKGVKGLKGINGN
jgi:hypothetical protein